MAATHAPGIVRVPRGRWVSDMTATTTTGQRNQQRTQGRAGELFDGRWKPTEQRQLSGRCVFVDASVQRELGLEVRVLAVAVGHVLRLEDRHERLDDVAVQLRAADPAQLGDRRL